MKAWPYTVLLSLLVSGCQSVTEEAALPAVLTNSNAQVQQELVAVISHLSGISKVRIGTDALTTNSYLTLDRVKLRDATGLTLQGLETEEPITLRLVKANEACFLTYLKSGQRARLELAQCQVAKL